MLMMCLKLLLLLYMSYGEIEGVVVFSFPRSPDENLSYVSLETSEKHLFPDKIIVCLSHMETQIEGRSFITILGENGKTWLSLSIWHNQGIPSLWMYQNNIWYHTFDINLRWLNFWIHTAILIDTGQRQISLLLNREILIVKDIKDLQENMPLYLREKLFIGKGKLDGEDWKQFKGSVTNLKVSTVSHANLTNTADAAKKLLENINYML